MLEDEKPKYEPKCERCGSINVYPHDPKSLAWWCCKDCGKTGENWDISKEQIEEYNVKRRESGRKGLANFGLVSAALSNNFDVERFMRIQKSLRKMNDADRGKIK